MTPSVTRRRYGDRAALHPQRRRRLPVGKALAYLVLAALSALFLLPLFWLLTRAVKNQVELSKFPVVVWPAHPSWHNFIDAFTFPALGVTGDFFTYALHSLELASISTVEVLLSSAMVGFGFARLRGRGKGFLFMLMLSTMMLPGMMMVIPNYIIYSRIHLIYTYWPWVIGGFGASPFFAFLFRQFFSSVPRELEDAAIVDGCGYVRMFWSMFLPLSKPVIAAVAIFSFQGAWGDWFMPLLFLNNDNTTLMVQINVAYASAYAAVGYLPWLQAAGALWFLLPVLVVFLAGQRYFVQGIVTTGFKG
jgi:ABC-type glycerol-3-phosphate transport system permease component